MEVPRPFEFKNASLTSDLMRRFSSLDINERCPLNNAKTEHYQRNATGESHHRPRRATRCNLPRRATNILKDWLLQNWYDAYPTEEEKYMLAHATGLKIEQVKNWLINARRRILPSICHKYGLDHSKRKIAKRGGNRNHVLERPRKLDCIPGSFSEWSVMPPKDHPPYYGIFAKAFPESVSPDVSVDRADQVPSPNVTYNMVFENPDSTDNQAKLEYLADVMLVNEELENQPNEEGLSRLELLYRRGLGELIFLQ